MLVRHFSSAQIRIHDLPDYEDMEHIAERDYLCNDHTPACGYWTTRSFEWINAGVLER